MEWRNEEIPIFNSLDSPEVLFIYFGFSMIKKMFFNYMLPIAQRIIPLRYRTPLKNLKIARFDKHRKYIATQVKSAYEKVKIFVISDTDYCNDVIERRMLGDNAVNFVGLDCEWESSKKNGVALIQLSSGNDCVLYRMHKANNKIPQNLRTLLEDRKILKFGVAIQEDVRRLRSHGISVKGFVDLRNLALRCLPPNVFEDPDLSELYQWTSLRSLSLNALNIKLSKNYQIRCGDWEAHSLNKQQVVYAAKDAIVSLEVFYALVLLRKLHRQDISTVKDSFDFRFEVIPQWVRNRILDSEYLQMYVYSHSADKLVDLPVLPAKFTLSKPSPWLKELAYSLCQGIVDANHKYRPPVGIKTSSRSASSSRGLSTKAYNEKLYKHQCRDKPLYENCYLLAPDQRVLATVNKSKAKWYVHKGLGVIDKEEPFTVRLLFEPSGRPMPDADYYTTEKENICVVCGGTESFVRKMIIPHDYRKYFPQNFKDHMSHDVLLMCVDCHRMAQQSDEQMKQDLADKYNAPMGTKERMMMVDNPDLAKVRSAAKALFKSGTKIPAERRAVLEQVVKDYYAVDELNEEMLKQTLDMDVKMSNNEFKGTHGQRVVSSVIEEGKLVEFVRSWREHFLQNMQPKFLPPMWSVDHNLHKIKTIEQLSPEEQIPSLT